MNYDYLFLNNIFNETKIKLSLSGVENSAFETNELFKHFLNFSKNDLILKTKKLNSIDQKAFEKLDLAIKKRCDKYPLQYLIGVWEFFGHEFLIGEGVLIPRQDTEILIEKLISLFKKSDCLKFLDLCSGSGAIAISLGKHFINSCVYAVEKSTKAFEFLEKNIKLNNADNVFPYLADLLNCENLFICEKFDVIVSNPPYIKTKDIENLQPEVLFEPEMALDGGEDGLYFYKNITKIYKKYLNPGGILIYEIGFDQKDIVSDILTENGFSSIKSVHDYSDNPRIIMGELTDNFQSVKT